LLTIPLQAPPAGITEVLNPKGLRVGMNKTKQDTYREGHQLMTNWQNFIFLSQLYKKEEET
jgi:hypothetical protein